MASTAIFSQNIVAMIATVGIWLGAMAGNSDTIFTSATVDTHDANERVSVAAMHQEQLQQRIHLLTGATLRSSSVVTTTIRLRFDGCSTVYQRSLRSQWRNMGRWPASRSHVDIFIYLRLNAAESKLNRSCNHRIRRFDCDSTAVRLPFDCNSTALRPFDDINTTVGTAAIRK